MFTDFFNLVYLKAICIGARREMNPFFFFLGNSHPLDEENLNEVETVKLSAFKIVVRLLLLNPDKYSLQRRNFFQVFIEVRILIAILNTMTIVEGMRFLQVIFQYTLRH